MRVIESEFLKSVRGRGITGGITGVPESSTMVYPSQQDVLTDDIFEGFRGAKHRDGVVE